MHPKNNDQISNHQKLMIGSKEHEEFLKDFLKKYPWFDQWDGTVTITFGKSELTDSNSPDELIDTENNPGLQYESFFTTSMPPIKIRSELSAVQILKVTLGASNVDDEHILHHFYQRLQDWK